MKHLVISIFLIFSTMAIAQEGTVYNYEVTTLKGDTISLFQFQGKKIMIVNTASKCGFTPQYEQLEEIYKKYKNEGFVVLGFPCNQFLFQAPGSAEEIRAFCTQNYGVTFPMMAKIKVKGRHQAPIYKYLTSKKLNGLENSKVKWNFQKYLIGRDGKLEHIYYSSTVPNDPKIIRWIEKD